MDVGDDVKDTDSPELLTARINELYQAMVMVERYGGCSVEVTEAINQLGKRINLLHAMRQQAAPHIDWTPTRLAP